LLKLGEVGASKIVKDTSLHGQTVYDSLHSLEEKNLARHSLQKGRKKFLAQNPSILKDLIERKKIVADEIVEKIENKFSTVDFQDIEIIKGLDSFFTNEIKLLGDTKKGAEILVFGGSGDSYVKSLGNNAEEYDYQRNKKEVVVKYIGGENEKNFLKDLVVDRPRFKYRYIHQALSGVTNITVYGDHALVIYLFDQTVTKIIIRNKKIVQSYTDFFHGLWKMAE
ncbi:hypothetical protein N9L18_01345, partial [Candidatus Pacebacteria bacterium]|nr:hypothetical protein [Candidatus Paceibacterota bacterium]